MSEIVQKPWGQEIVLTTSDLPYTSKLLIFKAGQRLSLQYHDSKTETLTLISGQAKIQSGLDKENLTTANMTLNTGYTIQATTLHRIEAVTDCTVVEASTPEIGTTFRLEDDYGRTDEKLWNMLH